MFAKDKLHGRRVLITEDEVLVAMELEYILRTAGCSIVGLATTIDGAEMILATEAIDFAILDVNLSGLLVFPLARLIISKNIPIIFLTGYAINSLVPDDFKLSTFLEKPVTESLLLKTAANLFVSCPV